MKALYWIAGIAVVAGAAWVVLGMPKNTGLGGWGEADPSKNTQEAAGGEPTQPTDAPAGETQQFKGSLQELVGRSGSWQCTVSVTAQDITTTGTTYVAGGKVRADYVSPVPGYGNVESHMIMRDTTVYTWTSLMSQGMKFPIQDGKMQGERKSTEVTPQFDQAYDYSCAAWTADESKFALPAGITF
jgi:hypothetical protein